MLTLDLKGAIAQKKKDTRISVSELDFSMELDAFDTNDDNEKLVYNYTQVPELL